jgi:dUTP pyrophosphatase
MQKISIKKLHNDVQIPTYATPGSAGLDLRAYIKTEAELTIPAGKRQVIPTGLAVSVPEGFEIQIRARSGLAFKHGLMLTNGIGTIDSDFRGEIKISLYNSSDTDYIIKHGDRVAQIVVCAYEKVDLECVVSLDDTSRGTGGFGHTGNA